MEFSGRGFISYSGQLSIATSKNPSMVNTKEVDKGKHLIESTP